jgi:hypothetical protein
MKRLFAAATVVLAMSVLSISTFAQYTPDVSPPKNPDRTIEQILKEARLDHLKREMSLRDAGPDRPGYAREPRVVKKGLLAPSQDDRLRLAAFLQTPNTGLIRLLPREVYDSRTYHTPKKTDIPGGGAYYSFSSRTHVYGYASDIELDHNKLTVGFTGADYGMLTSLGDVPIEAITLDDPRVQFLSSYRAHYSEPLARAEFRRLNKGGILVDGLHYQRRLPATENTTYLLRSIVYDTTDVLVALRVVRKDTDGSVIIAWKRLKNYPIPKLHKIRARR